MIKTKQKTVRIVLYVSILLIFVFLIGLLVFHLYFYNYGEDKFLQTNKLFKNNKELFVNIVESLTIDTNIFQIRKDAYLTSNKDSFVISKRNKVSYKIDSYSLWDKIYWDKNIYDATKLKSIRNVFMDIGLYCITNYYTQYKYIVFLFDDGISIVYLGKGTSFSPETGERIVFKRLEGDYYYYFTPINGFF